MLDVDLDGRCERSSATDALNRDRQDVYDACQDESDHVDVKQVLAHAVGDDADLTAKMMYTMWLKTSKLSFWNSVPRCSL